MSWFDLLLLVMVASCTAFAAQRKLSGLLVALGGLVLLKPLLLIGQINALFALLIALPLGLALGIGGRYVSQRVQLSNPAETVLGGIGGFCLGVTLTLALMTSFPLARDLNNRIVYPAPGMPLMMQRAVQESRFFTTGRDILLYPLLEAEGRIEPERRFMLRGFHSFLVVGRPWEGG